MTRRRGLLVLVLLGVLAVGTGSGQTAAAGASHEQIQGSGSSWSANAVNQWIADVDANGLKVVFTPNGSAQGRKDFGYRSTDFAVSEIGFRGTDPLTGQADNSQGRDYAYLPLVSGGTAFPYQIRVKGQLVRNLRLSGESLAKIFMNEITDWSDPAITADNNGNALPALPIVPVVHSEGSGSSAHFSEYLANQFPALWKSFSGLTAFTEYFPRKGNAIAQSGSDGVMNFVSSKAANGAIGFDEYSYALGKDYPVAKIENAAGYYTLPTQYNVAVALTQAVINQDRSSPNYLLQDLRNVYSFNDSRTYPLSSYSYGILPTAADDKITTGRRQTLADFLFYSICDGQKEMGPIGYSPLPINLVQAGFEQIGLLAKADKDVDLTSRDVASCHNPTFIAGEPDRNYLAEIAPAIPACDQDGQGPCTDSNAGTDPTTSAGAAHPEAQTTSGVVASAAAAGGNGGAGGTGGASGSGSSAAGGTGGTGSAAQGLASSAAAPNGISATVAAARAAGQADVPAAILAHRPSNARTVFGLLAALLLVAIVVSPATLSRLLARKAKDAA